MNQLISVFTYAFLLGLTNCKHDDLIVRDSLIGNCNELAEIYPDSPPIMSHEDSVKAQKYYEESNKQLKKVKASYRSDGYSTYYENILCGEAEMFNRVVERIDKLQQKKVRQTAVHLCFSNSIIIRGTVIDKQNMDTNNCLMFKTNYKVKVNEIYWSAAPIQEGDIINIKSQFHGYLGGCSDPPNTKLEVADVKELNIGDRAIIQADRGHYTRVLQKLDRIQFQDTYCTNAYAFREAYNEMDGMVLKDLKTIKRITEND